MTVEVLLGLLVYITVGIVLYYFGDVYIQNYKFPPLVRFLIGPILVAFAGYVMILTGHLMVFIGSLLCLPIDMFF